MDKTKRLTNNWHLKEIPKILHLYWGGGKLSYLRYLTIATFHYYNPEWKIILYSALKEQFDYHWKTHEQEYSQDYVDCYWKINDDVVRKVVVDFDAIGFHNDASAVHKSDFIRWKVLSETGGVWADMDVLFIKPMTDLYFNTRNNRNVNTVFCIEPDAHYHSIGFLMSSANNDYYKIAHRYSFGRYNKTLYQSIGSEMLNEHLPTLESGRIGNSIPLNVTMDVVYAYNGLHVHEIFGDNAPQRLTERSIGIHWYAGHQLAGRYLNATNGGLKKLNNSVIEQQIEKFYENINSNGVL